MVRLITSYKPFTQISNKKHLLREKGMTLIEILVAGVVALLVLSMSLSITLSSNRLYNADSERTATVQNLRGTLDIIGTDIREAGENLSTSVPAIEVINGVSGGDTLITRRILVDTTLTLCEPSNSPNGLIVADANLGSLCQFYDADTDNNPSTVWYTALEDWTEYRTEQGGSFRAFIYDYGTETGEFLNVTGEFFDGTTLYGLNTTSTLTKTYPVDSSVFILEERRFELVGNEIKLTINDDAALSLTFDVEDMAG